MIIKAVQVKWKSERVMDDESGDDDKSGLTGEWDSLFLYKRSLLTFCNQQATLRENGLNYRYETFEIDGHWL